MSLAPFLVVVLGIPAGMAAIIGLMTAGNERKSRVDRPMRRMRAEISRLNSENAAQ
ncbi:MULTISPECIES: hypothetical protein [Rhodococcus]|jgi:hypothetical protein|uniref:Uncharacterized protein n=1 Tax=Rhodococcus baikonurensis TaxID=172041 RepID=A0ABV5XSH3_9NOCA|nr:MULTISPECIES: hypothetical protein [Rhodococcus]MCY4669803.1 hypothetical protein [Rhodococcus sp. (in: high G+C Gram-positive bacteria)]NHP17187.1 hypothetical protein [Rhodococcus sp. IC4_135]MBP1054259.1 hypothetical protein [Rhodococcus qingshengii]MCJ0950290.1 hypothetical protein [Rhodococcus sp. ARC_M8]MCZ4569861.1 hypothetical protein [Rhodococcus erythropolis]